MDKTCETLLRAAIQAPSGDNTQPWRFEVDAGSRRIRIFLDESRDPSPMNADQRMARLAIGAALENIHRAAESLGCTLNEEKPGDGALVALRIENGEGPRGEVPPAIFSRCTNRRVYDSRPLSADLASNLAQAVICPAGIQVAWIHQRERVLALADLVGKADALMLSEPSMRQAFLNNIRFDANRNQVVDEGLPIASLEIPAGDRIALRLMPYLPDWLVRLCGAAGKLAVAGRRLVASSAGICIVTQEESTVPSELLAGRTFQRAWLALAERGVSVQPQMSIAILEYVLRRGSPRLLASLGERSASDLVRDFRSLAPEIGNANLAFVMRFGYAAPPTVRTGRLSMSANVSEITAR